MILVRLASALAALYSMEVVPSGLMVVTLSVASLCRRVLTLRFMKAWSGPMSRLDKGRRKPTEDSRPERAAPITQHL